MTALDILQHDGVLVVTSEQVAAGAGVEHRAVLQLIGNNVADFEEFGHLAFEMRDRPGVPGPALRVALLNEQQATLLMTYQRNTEQVRAFKKALVKAFFEMGRAVVPALPQDYASALRALVAEVEGRAALEAKIADDAPKVDYVDRFVAVRDDAITFRVASSQLGIGEQEMRSALLAAGWIHRVLIGQRWSAKDDKLVDEWEYRPSSGHKDLFTLRPQHNAPRHHNGQVRQTLYVLSSAMPKLERKVCPAHLVPAT